MSEKNETIIELAGVTKRFDGRTVIDGLTLAIRPGETMVIMGSSGCGNMPRCRMPWTPWWRCSTSRRSK